MYTGDYMFETLYMKVALVVVAFLAVTGANYVFKWKHDNPVEEGIEKVVKDQAGIDIDLTPLDEDMPDESFDLDRASGNK
jgi:hypothetical protein